MSLRERGDYYMLGRMFFQFFFLKRIKKKKFYLMREDFPLPVGPKRITFNESGINSRFFSDFSILNSERVSLKSTIFLLRTCKILFSLWGCWEVWVDGLGGGSWEGFLEGLERRSGGGGGNMLMSTIFGLIFEGF